MISIELLHVNLDLVQFSPFKYHDIYTGNTITANGPYYLINTILVILL